MKKSILLIIAALFFSLGTQQVTAQERVSKEAVKSTTSELETAALKHTKTLQRHLGLSKDQIEQVYNIYLELGKKMKGKSSEKLNVEDQKALQEKTDEYLDYKLKAVLSPEQYTKFQDVKKKL